MQSMQYCSSDVTREFQLSSKVQKTDNLNGGHMWCSSPESDGALLWITWAGSALLTASANALYCTQ